MKRKEYGNVIQLFLTIIAIYIFAAILSFCRCNPVDEVYTSAKYIEITVYICLAPTRKCITRIPKRDINYDSLHKYLDVDPENGFLKANLTSLRVKKRIGTVSLEAIGCSEKAKSEYRYPKEITLPYMIQNIEEFNADSIVVFLDVGGMK